MRLVAAFFSGAILMSATAAGAQEIDWQKVDNAFGRKAAVVSGDVHERQVLSEKLSLRALDRNTRPNTSAQNNESVEA